MRVLAALLLLATGGASERLLAPADADPADGEARVMESVAALELAMRVQRQDEHAIGVALTVVDTALLMSWAWPEVRWSAPRVTEACADIVGGTHGAALREHAVATLGLVAGCHGVFEDQLVRIVAVCEQSASSPASPPSSLFRTLSVVASATLHASTVRSVVHVAELILRRTSPPDEEGPGWDWQFIESRMRFDAIALVSEAFFRAMDDVPTCVSVVRAVRLAMDSARSAHQDLHVRNFAMGLLSRVLDIARSAEVFAEVLDVLEVVAAGGAEHAIVPTTSRMLNVVASGVDAALLRRAARVCAIFRSAEEGRIALSTIVTRSLGQVGETLDAEERVQVIANGMVQMGSLLGGELCGRVFGLLATIPERERGSHGELRCPTSELSPEMSMLVGDFIPPRPAEWARLAIVAVCAAASRHNAGAAWSLLDAARLRPRRVGLEAAKAFAAAASVDHGRDAFDSLATPGGFASVGEDLRSSLPRAWADAPGPERQAKRRRWDPRGAGVDALFVERIASELLDAAAAIFPERQAEPVAPAFQALCELAGDAHGVCRWLRDADAPRAASVGERPEPPRERL